MSILKGTFTLIFLTFLVTACGHSAADREDTDPGLKKMHIDASLFFAIALPSQWKKAAPERWPPATDSSVTWRSEGQNEAGPPDVVVRITSRPPEFGKGGFHQLKSDFFARRTGVAEISSEHVEINGRPALQVVGRFADRKALITFITTYRRVFTLEFTTHAGEFNTYRPLFEEILQSFQPL